MTFAKITALPVPSPFFFLPLAFLPSFLPVDQIVGTTARTVVVLGNIVSFLKLSDALLSRKRYNFVD